MDLTSNNLKRLIKPKQPTNHIYVVTRQYDTLIHLVGYRKRRCDTLTIVVTKNSGSGKAVSLQPSQLALGDMVMREPYSLLAKYASAERGWPATMIGMEE